MSFGRTERGIHLSLKCLYPVLSQRDSVGSVIGVQSIDLGRAALKCLRRLVELCLRSINSFQQESFKCSVQLYLRLRGMLATGRGLPRVSGVGSSGSSNCSDSRS